MGLGFFLDMNTSKTGRFWLRWVLSSTLGFAIGHGFFELVLIQLRFVLSGEESFAIWGAGLGAILGTLQWFVVRDWIRSSPLWVVASSIALAVGMPVGVIGGLLAAWTVDARMTGGLLYRTTEVVVYGLIAGVALGVAQGMILQRSLPRSLGWWVLANLVGWAGAMTVYWLPVEGRFSGQFPTAIVVLVSGGLYGITTASFFVRLLNRPLPDLHVAILAEG